MTFHEAQEYIASLRGAGMQMGLERMQEGTARLGHPEKAYPSVHIAGTNGKGSTAHLIAAALTAEGYVTGLYTSPYLTDYRDTIVINGERLSEDAFASCADEVRRAVPEGLSEYEFLTLLCFCAFRKAGVRIAVIECCLGGETDATNVIPPPLCAVFTPIALDHTAILGDTVEAIALQKSGIAKAPCDIVCAPTMHEEALGVLYERAALNGQKVLQPTLPREAPVVNRDGTHFVRDGWEWTLRMLGAHQVENAATALRALDCLGRHGFAVSRAATERAFQSVCLPCRQEVLGHDPFLLLDGAHNPHGIQALCNLLRTLSLSDVTLVIGMLADKDVDTCLALLSPYCARIVCCTPPRTPRALSADTLAAVARRYHPSVDVIADPLTALSDAKKADQRAIVVGGSFYTASAVRQALLSSENNIIP